MVSVPLQLLSFWQVLLVLPLNIIPILHVNWQISPSSVILLGPNEQSIIPLTGAKCLGHWTNKKSIPVWGLSIILNVSHQYLHKTSVSSMHIILLSGMIFISHCSQCIYLSVIDLMQQQIIALEAPSNSLAAWYIYWEQTSSTAHTKISIAAVKFILYFTVSSQKSNKLAAATLVHCMVKGSLFYTVFWCTSSNLIA